MPRELINAYKSSPDPSYWITQDIADRISKNESHPNLTTAMTSGLIGTLSSVHPALSGLTALSALTDPRARAAHAMAVAGGTLLGALATAKMTNKAPLRALGGGLSAAVSQLLVSNSLPERKYVPESLMKTAGGPGSGVSGDNTKLIPAYPQSPWVTIGTRKHFLDTNNPIATDKSISISDIVYVGQEKYVPVKLRKFYDAHVAGETWMWDKPIEVTIHNGKYAVVDGHHRFLAALLCGKKTIKVNIYQAPSLEKTAGPAGAILGGAKKVGKGLWNVAFGGKNLPNGAWDPLAGVGELGRVRKRVASGPLKGMFEYNTQNGDHVFKAGKRSIGGFMRDAFTGNSATRADIYAKQMAAKQKVNVGQFMKNAPAEAMNTMGNMNRMSVTDFIKKHPGTAASYYGRNALHKTFFAGIPAAGVVNTLMTGKKTREDAKTTFGDIAGTAAEGFGFAAAMPLGLVGSPLIAMGLGNAFRKAGDTAVSAFNKKPAPMPMSTFGKMYANTNLPKAIVNNYDYIASAEQNVPQALPAMKDKLLSSTQF